MFIKYTQIVLVLFSVSVNSAAPRLLRKSELITQFNTQAIPKIPKIEGNSSIEQLWAKKFEKMPESIDVSGRTDLNEIQFNLNNSFFYSYPQSSIPLGETGDKNRRVSKELVFVICDNKVYYTIATYIDQKSPESFTWSFQPIMTKEYQKEREEQAKKTREKEEKEMREREAERARKIDAWNEEVRKQNLAKAFKVYTKDAAAELSPTFDDKKQEVTLKNGAITKTLPYHIFIKLIEAYDEEYKKAKRSMDKVLTDLKNFMGQPFNIKLLRNGYSGTIWFEFTV